MMNRLFSRPQTVFSYVGFGAVVMVVIALVYFNTTYSSGSASDGVLSTSAMNDPHGVWKYGCEASPNAPVLVHVETKLGVNYNAGHWFHMSELIMTQHAALRKQGKLVNSSAIYVNFDKGTCLVWAL